MLSRHTQVSNILVSICAKEILASVGPNGDHLIIHFTKMPDF